jgi:hypothetical protein
MKKIYTKAQRAIAWLGTGSENPFPIIEAIGRLSQTRGSPPSRVLSGHFRLVSGAGAATPFCIYIGAFAHINSSSSERFQPLKQRVIHLRHRLSRVQRVFFSDYLPAHQTQTLLDFFDLPYWKRSWIIQELLLAPLCRFSRGPMRRNGRKVVPSCNQVCPPGEHFEKLAEFRTSYQ